MGIGFGFSRPIECGAMASLSICMGCVSHRYCLADLVGYLWLYNRITKSHRVIHSMTLKMPDRHFSWRLFLINNKVADAVYRISDCCGFMCRTNVCGATPVTHQCRTHKFDTNPSSPIRPRTFGHVTSDEYANRCFTQWHNRAHGARPDDGGHGSIGGIDRILPCAIHRMYG